MLTTYFKHSGEDVKLKLFKAYCYSMYGTHLWSECTNTGYDRIRKEMKILDLLKGPDAYLQ